MVELTTEQIADLRELQQFCAELNADVVIIGAIAYQYHFPRENRHTSDIDSAVALDLDDFAELEKRLQVGKWRRIPNREHRWRSSRGTLLDLIPAGTELRKAKQVTWPESQFTMSLVGFDHVFGDSEAVELSPELTLKIIPSIVLVLLKIVAFLDDQQGRAKDLLDIRSMLFLYEEDSERIFSDVVLDAKLADFALASAFLVGIDLRSLCTLDELVVVREFVKTIRDEAKPAWPAFVRAAPHAAESAEEQARAQFAAFEKGLNRGGKSDSVGSSKKEGKGEKARPPSILDRLQSMATARARVRVAPLTPPNQLDEFQIVETDSERNAAVLRKASSSQQVYVPISQISDVRYVGTGRAEILQLDGRLQWLTLAEEWAYFPETPNDSWGISKNSGDNDTRVAEIAAQVRSKGHQVGWANENRVNTTYGSEREIIYDSDGRYFRKPDRPYNQILVRNPKRK
jgi:predicted nucleotidyltransferase